MKYGLSEYGKVISVIVAALGILLFLLGSGSDSFAGKMKAPTATYKTSTAENIVDAIATRPKPVLDVVPKKLSHGTTYNLLDTSAFGIIAKNADNTTLPVTITKIVYIGGTSTNEIDPETVGNITPEKPGYYDVTYHTEENYHGAILEKDTTVTFVID